MNEDIKKREARFYLVLPLIVVPFITFVFWAFDGGEKLESSDALEKGLLTHVPDVAGETEEVQGKLESYQQAERDSLKWLELAEMDPSTASLMDGRWADHDLDGYGNALISDVYQETDEIGQTDVLLERLARLQEQLRQPQIPANRTEAIAPRRSAISTSEADGAELERLEELMGTFSRPQHADPETAELNAMLEKILDIQHPERINRKLNKQRGDRFSASYPVQAIQEGLNVTHQTEHRAATSPPTGFYGLKEEPSFGDAGNTIRAVIHEDQTLVNGSVVKLRLEETVRVGQVEIPKDSFIFGLAQLQDERLEIEIETIRSGSSIVPVSLKVFDLDGLSGIHIPGAITRKSTQQSADRSLQMMRLSSIDASLAGQAASAGVEAAKDLMGKKIRLTKVKVKAGYHVLLRDEKERQEWAARPGADTDSLEIFKTDVQ